MTINIAIAVSEGLVMAADSMTQINAPNGAILKSYPTAEKITELGNLAMAAMCSGLGAISQRSIMSYIREFEFDVLPTLGKTSVEPISREKSGTEKQPQVQEVAEKLKEFIRDKYENANWPEPPKETPTGLPTAPWPPSLTIVVGGYSPRSFFPEVYQIDFPSAEINQRHPVPGAPKGQPSITWWGIGTSLNRLLHGFDINELQMAHLLLTQNPQALQTVGIAAPELPPNLPAPNVCLGPLAQLAKMQVVLDFMPLQEAVEFADYLGHVAIGYSRFSAGNQIVGGELDVLAIQPEGLSWYRRKTFVANMASARRNVFK